MISIILSILLPNILFYCDDAYYSKEEVLPCIEKTLSEKRGVWFEEEEKGWLINWDAERLPFNTIVLHYLDNFESFSETEKTFKEFYIKRYNSSNNDPYVKGLKVHSGHVFCGEETFIGYHYLIYPNGGVVSSLNPIICINGTFYIDQVAWHSGNWKTNCESISIGIIRGNNTIHQQESIDKLIESYRLINSDLKIITY